MIKKLVRRVILWAVPEAGDPEELRRQIRVLDNRVRRISSR